MSSPLTLEVGDKSRTHAPPRHNASKIPEMFCAANVNREDIADLRSRGGLFQTATWRVTRKER